MGLIDDIREKRDSWMRRFEEHRQDEGEEAEYSEIDRGKEEVEILKNRQTVGVFRRKDQTE
jgi:hypothetical protein